MTSTYTPNKNLELPGYNDYVDSWNVPVNADFTAIDTALGGSTTLNVTGISGDVTLTSTQYRPPQIIITGTLTANVRYIVPAGVGGQWTITNLATGLNLYTVKIASAAGGFDVTLPVYSTIVSCDGTSSGMRLSITSTAVQRVDTFSAGTTGLTPAIASVGNIQLGGTLNIANGGTGTTTAPTSGQLLIGKLDGTYAVTNLSGGSGINIVNSDGGITINAASTAGGTVTSVALNSNLSGITIGNVGGNPITSSGSFTLQGTLGIANGGTGLTAIPTNGQIDIGNGVGFVRGTISGTAPISVTNGPGSIGVSLGTVPIANGGTGITNTPSTTQTLVGNGSGGYALKTLVGGTGITINDGPSTVTFTSSATGTVTSVGLSTTLSGLTVTNSPVTGSGTIALGGTLGVSSGGTGSTTAAGALSNLGAASLTTNTFSGTQTAPTFALASNSAKFYTNGLNTIIDFNANSNVYYNGSNLWEFSINGAKAFSIKPAEVNAYAFNVYSDRALKKDITPVTGGLGRVLSYQPVTYRWIDQQISGDTLNEGFIAQDVGVVNPTAVTYSDGVASFNPIPIIADLVAAVQELSARVQALEAKLAP